MMRCQKFRNSYAFPIFYVDPISGREKMLLSGEEASVIIDMKHPSGFYRKELLEVENAN